MSTKKKTPGSNSCSPRERTGRQRRAILRCDVWLCGDPHGLTMVVPHFEEQGWKVVQDTPTYLRLVLEAAEPRVPDIRRLVVDHPEVAVLARLYNQRDDSLTIIAGSKFNYTETVETMHVFSHAEYYGVPADANMFDY